MSDQTKEQLVNQKAPSTEEKKQCAFDVWPYVNVALMIVSILILRSRLYTLATKAKIPNIVKFMFSWLKEQNQLTTKGEMWRETFFYSYLVFCSFMGLLNAIPKVKLFLGGKPVIPGFVSRRSLLLNLGLILLIVLWFWATIALDMHSVEFKKNPPVWFYRISCPALNLFWTLAIIFCTRNTVFQYIYQIPYASLISTHRAVGTTAFYLTFFHVFVIIRKWMVTKRFTTFKAIIRHMFHYSPDPIDWKELDFMSSTDLLFKTMPLWALMMLAAVPWCRRKAWELFFYLHQVVMIVLFVLFYFHSRNFIFTAFLPLALYVVDKLVRWISIYTRCCRVTQIHAYEDMVHLEITVNTLCKRCEFPFLVGSVAYIRIPEAKCMEYHPISIAYNNGNVIGFFIKVVGGKCSWSHKLALLSDKKDLRAFVEGPYTMVKRASDKTIIEQERVQKAEKVLRRTYEKNVVVVGGGAGFGGVSANLLDVLRAVQRLPAEEQAKYTVNVMIVVPHHAHLECMKNVLAICKQCPFCKLHLYATYSKNEELKMNSPKGKDANTLTTPLASEDSLTEYLEVHYTVGRPDFEAILASLNDEAISAFVCGPKNVAKSFYKALCAQKRPFSFHSDVFDMCCVCWEQRRYSLQHLGCSEGCVVEGEDLRVF